MESTSEMVHVPQNSAALAAPIETAAAGVAAQEEAKIRARYALAIQQPRDIDMVRSRLLKACSRPRFAEAARYSLPRGGKKIEGPSIRFAEEVARSLGNVSIDSAVVHDDAERRVIRVTVTDVEANLPLSTDVVVEKFVERNQLRQGQEALSSRMNSAGKVVYRIPADEGELVVKQAALTSKALRNLVLRILPADVLEEAMDACLETMTKRDAQDPDATRKAIFDNYAKFGVSAADLKAYVGNDMAHVDRATWQELRDLHTAIKEGAITWPEAVEARATERGNGKASEQAQAAPKSLDELAKQRKAKKSEDAPHADREPGSEG